MAEVHGSCDTTFKSVRDLLQQKLADGGEVGASICINIDGKNIVDIWGGHADAGHTKPWGKDTITAVWSCTKIVSNLAIYILVNRGLLDPNEKVTTYWPEFGVNGKDIIKVSHILSHSSGIPAFDGPISLEDFLNVEKSTQRLAAQAPWFTPGSQSAYQYTNHGHMLGELIRRVSGKSVTQFVTEEITKPLGVDFQLGVLEEDWPRTAELIPFPAEVLAAALKNLDPDPTTILNRTYQGSLLIPTIPNEPLLRKSENGAIGGFSNARALARIGSMVSLGGTVDGKEYLTPQTLDQVTREQISGFDPGHLCNMRWALGLALPGSGLAPMIPEDDGICFWGGWGGSMLVMDRGRRMTIAYVMNKMDVRPLSNANFDAYFPESYKSFQKYSKN